MGIQLVVQDLFNMKESPELIFNTKNLKILRSNEHTTKKNKEKGRKDIEINLLCLRLNKQTKDQGIHPL